MTSESPFAAFEDAAVFGSPAEAVGRVIDLARYAAGVSAERLEWVDAARRRALTEAAESGRTMSDVVQRGIRLELAAALRISEHAAGRMLSLAEALLGEYRDVHDAFSAGEITEQHAEILVDTVAPVEPELRDAVVATAIGWARVEPVGTFRRRLRRLVDTVRATTLADRHAAAVAERRVVMETDANGMGWLHLHAPAVEVHAIFDRVTRIAKAIAAADGAAEPSDSGEASAARTLDQVRADTMCDLLIDGDVPAHPDGARGIRAAVVVTVPALTLLDADAGVSEPAVVEGLGPIPHERARELCGGAEGWTRILTHPESGIVLSVGTTRYRPPPALRGLVRWRAERCMAPGCGVPASRCEIDHTVAWEHGGTTSLTNLAPLCRGHHLVKHHSGWSIAQLPGSGGAIEWTSPAGRRYIVHPERRIPAFRATGDGEPPPF